MMNDPVNPNHIGDASVAATRMTTQSSPPSLAPKTAHRTSLGHRLQRALAGGSNRRFPGFHSPPGGAASLSPFLNRRLALPILAILAVLAASLLFLMPGGPLQAQDSSIIYEENGTDHVATFTGSDPEGRPVYWSLTDAVVADVVETADIADREHFMISSDGVLSFRFSPDYEMPRGNPIGDDNTNTYKVVVEASDDAPGAGDAINIGYEMVTVMVTDMDDPGMVSLSAQQPQVDAALTATLTDDDATTDQITAAKWKWDHSSAANGPWTPILTATTNSYLPLGVVDKYLRVTATYTDEHGSDKSESAVSANMVRAEPANNAAPVFPSESGARSVDENSPSGTNVGKPVAADDAAGDDKLTYTLSGSDLFDINPATGQITVGARTTLDAEGTPTYNVTVTATDPAGASATPSGATEQAVIITVNNVNEAPMITDGFTENSQNEHDADTGEAGIDAAKTVDTYVAEDVDQTDPLSWSVSGTDAGDFDISSDGGVLTFKEAPNYEMPTDSNRDNVYMVTVVATDAGVDSKNKMTAERDVVITVMNVDEDGTVTLSSVQPKVGIELTAEVTDLDGDPADIKWEWRVSTSGTAENPETGCAAATYEADPIEDVESGSYTPEKDDIGKCLQATAMYTDDKGMDTAMEMSANAVLEDQANKAPEFDDDASYSRTIDENVTPDTALDQNPANVGDVVTATDPNDDNLTYSLSGNDAGSFMIGSSDGQISAKMKLDHEAKSSYTVTVKATDPSGLSDSVEVTIKVTNVDEAPTIAGDDITKDYPENGRVQVARFNADDPEGRPVYWSLTDAVVADVVETADIADREHFMISSDGVLSFRFSPDYEMPRGNPIGDDNTNTYKVVVEASDDPTGAGDAINIGYKMVTVMVTNVQETETITLSVQQAQVDVVLTATYNDLDNERPDDADLTWTWYLGGSQIPGAGGTGATLTSSYTPDKIGSLRVEASYTRTDGTVKTVLKTVNVRAEPANNAAPVFPSGSGARSVDENSPPGTNVGKRVAADDDDAGDKLTYTLSGSDLFDINPATGQITVGARTTLDAEGTPTYNVTVTATDPAGASATPSGATEQAVIITVNNVNEAPMITDGFTENSQNEHDADTGEAGIDAAKTVDTYVAEDVDQTDPLSWSVSGTDAGDFDISSDGGVLTFKEAPNYEMPTDSNRDNVYMVTVVATDAGVDSKNKMTAERDVVITVMNVDEDGTVTLSSVQPKVGIELTAEVTDLDGDPADIKWEWRVSTSGTAENPETGCAAATYEADPIEDVESGSYTPEKDDIGKCLQATAMYTDDKGMDTAMEMSANAVLEDQANKAPEFDDDASYSRTIDENVTPDTALDQNPANVGDVVTATDPNDDNLTYSLSGNDAGSFMIGSSDGQISAKMKLDHEAKSSYTVTVKATDPSGLSDSVEVTIKVTNVDEAPTITRTDALTNQAPTFPSAATTREVAENTVAGEGIGAPVAATDADNDALTHALSGTDAASFDIISATGQLQTKAALDYETKITYSVTVTASDSGGLSDSIDVTITVTDVDEAGTGDPLVDGYDANDSGTIDRAEVGQAVRDFIGRQIEHDDVVKVIAQYFKDLRSGS